MYQNHSSVKAIRENYNIKESLHFPHTTESEINKIIRSINTKKATGKILQK